MKMSKVLIRGLLLRPSLIHKTNINTLIQIIPKTRDSSGHSGERPCKVLAIPSTFRCTETSHREISSCLKNQTFHVNKNIKNTSHYSFNFTKQIPSLKKTRKWETIIHSNLFLIESKLLKLHRILELKSHVLTNFLLTKLQYCMLFIYDGPSLFYFSF